MGWFGSSTPEPTAVTRGGRQVCWDNRDTYFACLDNNRVLKPGDEGKVCATEKVGYEKNCAKSWVGCFPQNVTAEFSNSDGTPRSNTLTKDAYWPNSRRGSWNR